MKNNSEAKFNLDIRRFLNKKKYRHHLAQIETYKCKQIPDKCDFFLFQVEIFLSLESSRRIVVCKCKTKGIKHKGTVRNTTKKVKEVFKLSVAS